MISAIVNTFNEEKNIEKCLANLVWTDEIIVIDMGSQDKTVALAKKYKAKIYSHPYINFVEPARNFAINKAKSGWILIVDADEEVPLSLKDKLLQLSREDKYDYLQIPRKNTIFGKWIRHCGWWPDYKVRFFKKGHVHWPNTIHGVPEASGTGFDLEAKEELALIHNHYMSISQYLTRMDRYTSVQTNQLIEEKKSFNVIDLLEKPVAEFIRRFLIWQGYKDGIHGLSLALLQAFSELVVYLKLWELNGFKDENIELNKSESFLKKNYYTARYWFINEQINNTQNKIVKLYHKIRRKLLFYV